MPVTEGRSFRREKLKIEVYPTREEAGAAAAEAAAAEMKRLGKEKETIRIIFATGASQLSTIRALTAIPGLSWERVEGFHMDEYVGIPPEHRASFRRYMRTELAERVRTVRFHEINGNASPVITNARSMPKPFVSQCPNSACRTLGIDDDGKVYGSFGAGRIFKYDPRADAIRELDARSSYGTSRRLTVSAFVSINAIQTV